MSDKKIYRMVEWDQKLNGYTYQVTETSALRGPFPNREMAVADASFHFAEDSRVSYKAEVIADSTGQWISNGLFFATREEAEKYGANLRDRWMAVQEYRVVEVSEQANYRWDEDTQRPEAV